MRIYGFGSYFGSSATAFDATKNNMLLGAKLFICAETDGTITLKHTEYNYEVNSVTGDKKACITVDMVTTQTRVQVSSTTQYGIVHLLAEPTPQFILSLLKAFKIEVVDTGETHTFDNNPERFKVDIDEHMLRILYEDGYDFDYGDLEIDVPLFVTIGPNGDVYAQLIVMSLRHGYRHKVYFNNNLVAETTPTTKPKVVARTTIPLNVSA